MRKLVIALALSALLASAPMAMAGSAGFQNWWQKWKIQQTEQQRIDKSLDKIDRDAASWGQPAGAGDQMMWQQPVSPDTKVSPEQ